MHYYIIKGISRPRSLYADGIYFPLGPLSPASSFLWLFLRDIRLAARVCASSSSFFFSQLFGVVVVVVVRRPISPLRVALFLARELLC